ncbi:sigma-54 interaction domain-containing protein [Desulfocurvus vexinensis]|uniref:sigma-54 interaction domain-containing protein n=1 Tax=Desulfocurvus vexinensis TaxID=399548 RepID=UPI00048ABC35|nr:sigma-54-dependent Fis family transcriptional regulator [Desulfocurvus vexinensis]
MHQDSVKQYLEEIIETMNEGLFIVGPDGRISMVNSSLERLTGFSRRELLGKPCTVLNCDACRISRREGRDHWCRLFDERKQSRKNCRIVRKDGSCVDVVKNATLLLDNGEVIAAVETLTDLSELVEKDRKIEELSRLLDTGFHGMIGHSPAMQRLYALLEKAARSDAPVIIFGESGTGKELAAHAIHTLGWRAERPFIQFNCAALNESLLESELFGHVKGAFTGAIRHREGRFEAADGGDIFLDEIGDVPPATQVKLLRVLESKRIERVGDNRPIEVDVRVITATNRNLERLVAEGAFRKDLFYRINVIPIHVPPLRERAQDIPLLAARFLEDIRTRTGRGAQGLTPEALRLLTAHPWPGNVRELKSALEYACVLQDAGPVGPEHLPPAIQNAGGAPGACPPPAGAPHGAPDPANAPGAPEAPHPALPANPRQALIDALLATGGNKTRAAALLGVSRGTVQNRMRRFGLDLKRVVSAPGS